MSEKEGILRMQPSGRWVAASDTSMTHPLFRIIAALDNHFAADDQLPADAARWRELKRHIVRDLVQTTLREERERGIPLTEETARKLDGYARDGLGE